MKLSETIESSVIYRVSPAMITNYELNLLFAAAWESQENSDFRPILERSLAYVCAYQATRLIGFVNLAWDGGIHAFILDTTVDKEFRRRGIGTELVKRAAEAAKEQGVEWLHVDFEPHLQNFYDQCGFRHTAAGLIRLRG